MPKCGFDGRTSFPPDLKWEMVTSVKVMGSSESNTLRFDTLFPISSCMWLYDGRVMVASDGDIYTCCLDGTGDGIIGNIMRDKVTDLEVKPYSLCDSCNQLYPMGEK